MTSDSQDSRHKHRRSPSDEESPENSKRHKHRHQRHHRRHRHHHRHSSKKHDEERKADEIEGDSKAEVEEVREVVSSADYDMEEGEIVEDEGPIAAGTELGDRKAESDVESGEFKVVECQTQIDDSYMRGNDAISNPVSNSFLTEDLSRKYNKNWKSPGSARSDDSKSYGSRHRREETSIVDNVMDHDNGRKSDKVSGSLVKSKSPSEGSIKRKLQHENASKPLLDLMEVDVDECRNHRNSSSRKDKEKYYKESSHSPSHGRDHLEASGRSGSASPQRSRRRERSQSILYDEHSRRRRSHETDEVLDDNGKVRYEFDVEKGSQRTSDYKLNGRDMGKDKGRETTSYHRYGGKDEGGDPWNGEREEMYKDKRKMKEREISRDRSEKGQDQDRDWERERDRKAVKDHGREKGSDRDWGKARDTKNDMYWGAGRDRENKRERDHGRSRDKDLEREQRMDDINTMYRDRCTKKERVKDFGMERGRDRNGVRDRNGDRTRGLETEKSRRHHRYDDHVDGYGHRDRLYGYDEPEYRRHRDRRTDSEKENSKDTYLMQNQHGRNRDDDDQKDYQERVDLELAEKEEDDVDKIKEESRRRREAILQKYKAKQLQQQAVPESAKVSNERPNEQSSQKCTIKNAISETICVKANGQDASAMGTMFPLGKSPLSSDTTDDEKSTGAGGLGEGTPKSEGSNDMFCDDIFGDSPAGVRKTGKGDGLPIERSGLHDNWDDPEGYYTFRFGEILDSRYEITAAHGKGVFSTVVRAKDLKAGPADREEVAIKIIRNNETMLKAGTEELVILKKLVGADPDDRRHCVRYLSHFKYRNHLCIVFESLHMNLREVLKKFGRNIGLKLTAVRAYAKQLFIALKHLRNCGVLHCDIKPDNMLVNEAKNVLKLCDFGNAMFAGKNEITPYLVSRFYRAPEIILGLPYDHPMDMWSVGCCLYELYTGKVLFPGPTNNDMLRLHMELKGPFPKKMLRKGAFNEQHFDQDLNFLATEEDPVTKKTIRRLILNIKPKDIGTIIKGSSGVDPKMLANFKDLLDKIFVLDPDKRLTVSQALNHPFITGK